MVGASFGALVLVVGVCAVLAGLIPADKSARSSAALDGAANAGAAPGTTSSTLAPTTAPPTTAPPTIPPTTPPPPACHPSYPTVCIPPAPPDLDCPEIQFKNFKVVGADPHGFDTDNDGIGCDTPPPPPAPKPSTTTKPPAGNCDPNYPTICVRPFAQGDLDCPEISYRNFPVPGADPHRFDADNDGIGCET